MAGSTSGPSFCRSMAVIHPSEAAARSTPSTGRVPRLRLRTRLVGTRPAPVADRPPSRGPAAWSLQRAGRVGIQRVVGAVACSDSVSRRAPSRWARISQEAGDGGTTHDPRDRPLGAAVHRCFACDRLGRGELDAGGPGAGPGRRGPARAGKRTSRPTARRSPRSRRAGARTHTSFLRRAPHLVDLGATASSVERRRGHVHANGSHGCRAPQRGGGGGGFSASDSRLTGWRCATLVIAAGCAVALAHEKPEHR